MALYANKDWTGRSIYKEDFDSTKPTPGFTRAKNTASSLSKSLAWFANSITGGTDYKQGVWSPTPDQIDFVIGQLTGGTGREIIHAQEVAAALVNNEEIPTNKLPIVGKLYGETKGNSVERSAFYDNLKLLNEHHAEVTGLRKEPGGAPKAIAYMRENPVAKLYPMAHDIHNQIDKMKDRHKRLEKSGASASSLRALDDQIAGRMKVLNDRVANALK